MNFDRRAWPRCNFSVTCSLAAGIIRRPFQPSRVMPDSKGKKILVVDDEADVTDLVAYHLKLKGFTVECVNDTSHLE